MAYIIFLVLLAVVGYVGWKKKAEIIALFKEPLQPPPADAGVEAKAPTSTVPGTQTPQSGILAGYLAPGSGNGVPTTGYDAKSQWRTDRNIDTLGYWKTPAGKAEYSVTAAPGSVVTFLVGPADEGVGSGVISARGIEQKIVNAYGGLTFQALDPVTALTVDCDKPVLIQRV